MPKWLNGSKRLGAFKNGAGTASSPQLVIRTAFFGDEPSPPLLTDFLERTLAENLFLAILPTERQPFFPTT